MTSLNYNGFLQEALLQIKDEFNRADRESEFYMTFSSIEYMESQELLILATVPSRFIFDRLISNKYIDLIENKLFELSGENIKIKLSIAPSKKVKQNNILNEENFPPKLEKKEKISHPKLNTRYRFENFVQGDNNAFALNASIGVSKNLGKAYNPLLIYGGVGLGKTHLMQAIGNEVYSTSDIKAEKIICVTAEDFINEFTESMRNGTQNKFKNKYRQADLLLIDDIHFLLGKTGTQEELFYTFEALYNANKQMVFTCDRPASELKDMSERLRSRISRGLNVDLTTPNYETRLAILRKKTSEENLDIEDDVLKLIAKNVSTNIRDLESSLSKIKAYQDLLNKKVTTEIAENILKEIILSSQNIDVTIDIIQKVVAEQYGISVSDLKGQSRKTKFLIPRQLAIYLSRKLTEYSLEEIGQEFGGKDHSTIIHSIEKIEESKKTDSSIESMLEIIKRKIKEYKAK